MWLTYQCWIFDTAWSRRTYLAEPNLLTLNRQIWPLQESLKSRWPMLSSLAYISIILMPIAGLLHLRDRCVTHAFYARRL